jgi:hypothetical protein
MNHKLKYVATRVSRASKSFFQRSSSSSIRREAMLRYARAHEEEEQQQCVEEEEQHCVEEEERIEEAALERVPRQTQRSHVVAPPPAPTWEEDRVLIRPVDDQ